MRIIILVALAFFAVACSSERFEPVVGLDYHNLSSSIERLSLKNQDKIELVEIFWYGCPSCYRFQGILTDWMRRHDSKVTLVYLPAALGGIWDFHARLYWLADYFNLDKAQFQDLIYRRLHEERKPILNLEQAVALFNNSFGIDKELFALAYNSKEIQDSITKSQILLRDTNIRSVPAIIIEGRYLVLENNDPDKMIKTVEFLVKKLEQERR